jgi:hypothetical protein
VKRKMFSPPPVFYWVSAAVLLALVLSLVALLLLRS